jgi:exodeoxyribonuclease V gamma subunit
MGQLSREGCQAMNIHFYFSDRLETVTDSFLQHLAGLNNSGRDPLRPLSVVVPGKSMQTWLQAHIADSQRIAINISYEFLEKYLSSLALDAGAPAGSSAGQRAVFLNQQERHLDMQLLLTRTILGTSFDPDSPLGSWIRQEKEGGLSLSMARTWQLASRLSQFFREYEYQRAAMIETWDRGDTMYHAGGFSRLEKDQARLYRDLFACKGSSGECYTTLPRFVRDCDFPVDQQEKNPRTVLLFNVSGLSPFHLDVMIKLAPFYTFHVYQVQHLPCFQSSGYDAWPAAGSPGRSQEKPGRLERDPQGDPMAAELLESARESAWLQSRFFETAGSPAPITVIAGPAGGGSSMLEMLQSAIRNGSSAITEKIPQDRSLQIFGAPGRWREIEAVYQNILWNLKDDDSLRFNDIALLVPDMKTYGPVIQAVFEKHRHLPWSLSSVGRSPRQSIGSALLSGFSLVTGSFSRADFSTLSPIHMS